MCAWLLVTCLLSTPVQITGLSGTNGLLNSEENAGAGLTMLILALGTPVAKFAIKRHTVVLVARCETGGSILKVL